MKLEVGKEYISRNGQDRVTIIKECRYSNGRYVGDDGISYAENGAIAFIPDSEPNDWDLVRPTVSPMQDVLAEVFGERVNQDAKWGQQDHSPSRWLSILGEEHGEVCRAVCEALANPGENAAHWANYREELIQLAAVAVSMVECFDRNNEETK